jgi:cob(I)alamin adenosyltransferase
VRIWTKTGDDGSTGLLYGGRTSKADLRVEAYGATDEAVAAIGLARAAADDDLKAVLLRLQRELFVAGAELATAPDNHRKLSAEKGTKVTAAMVDGLEQLLVEYEGRTEMPKEFVIPGETPVSSALDLARSIVRRAERRAVALADADGLSDGECVRYLNRLADLLFMLARFEEGGYTPLHG